jgi:hypothetical protein
MPGRNRYMSAAPTAPHGLETHRSVINAGVIYAIYTINFGIGRAVVFVVALPFAVAVAGVIAGIAGVVAVRIARGMTTRVDGVGGAAGGVGFGGRGAWGSTACGGDEVGIRLLDRWIVDCRNFQ